MTGLIKHAPSAIRYVELTYASENKLPASLIQNRSGAWIEPTATAATAAIEAFHDDLANDVRIPVVDPPPFAKDAYQISGLTYVLVPKQVKTDAKQQTPKDFLQYILTTANLLPRACNIQGYRNVWRFWVGSFLRTRKAGRHSSSNQGVQIIAFQAIANRLHYEDLLLKLANSKN